MLGHRIGPEAHVALPCVPVLVVVMIHEAAGVDQAQVASSSAVDQPGHPQRMHHLNDWLAHQSHVALHFLNPFFCFIFITIKKQAAALSTRLKICLKCKTK